MAVALLTIPFIALANSAPTPSIVRSMSDAVIVALKNNDMATVAFFTHPTKKLRIAPYPFLTSADQKFSASNVGGLLGDTTVRTWGHYDGSGNPISKTFANYYPEFVWSHDFTDVAIVVGENVRIHTAQLSTNWATVYPGRVFIEYNFPGTSASSNMDWRSFILIWQKDGNGVWRLVCMTNDMQSV